MVIKLSTVYTNGQWFSEGSWARDIPHSPSGCHQGLNLRLSAYRGWAPLLSSAPPPCPKSQLEVSCAHGLLVGFLEASGWILKGMGILEQRGPRCLARPSSQVPYQSGSLFPLVCKPLCPLPSAAPILHTKPELYHSATAHSPAMDFNYLLWRLISHPSNRFPQGSLQ